MYSKISSLPASKPSSTIRASTSASISLLSNETKSSWASPLAIASNTSGDTFSSGSNEAILLGVSVNFPSGGIFMTSVSDCSPSSSTDVFSSLGKVTSVGFSDEFSEDSSLGRPVNKSAFSVPKSLKSSCSNRPTITGFSSVELWSVEFLKLSNEF